MEEKKCFTLRSLTAEDVPAVMEMQRRVFELLPSPRWYYGSTEEEFTADITRRLSVGAFDGDVMAGFALAGFGEPLGEKSYAARIGDDPAATLDYRDVMVSPDYRRCGIQSTFLRHWDNVAREAGCKAVYATVDPENVPSYSSFEKAGYVRVCVKPAYDGRPRAYYKKTVG